MCSLLDCLETVAPETETETETVITEALTKTLNVVVPVEVVARYSYDKMTGT